MSFLKEHLTLLLDFFRSNFRRLLLWCAIGMIASVAAGCITAFAQPETVEEALNLFAQAVEEAGVVTDEGDLSVFALLANNWQAMLVAVTYGFFPFLYLPLLSLFSNGFLMGMMFAWYHTQGMGLPLLLAGLLPHGIFELPALVTSIACGIHLCSYMTQRIFGRSQRPLAEISEELLRVVVLFIAPLVVLGAFAECYITPLFMALFS